MSKSLLSHAIKYYLSGIDTDTFVDDFIKRWDRERNSGELSKDGDNLDLCLSNIFYAIDMYDTGETDLGSPELNKDHLRTEIGKQLHDLIRANAKYRKVYEEVEKSLKK
ncbi:colicin immunity domain-containing protein [Aestuariispira ectoiniformans]|uniref:colicin immunity domain-containing protein n=1 Tax=Aestuariispira ectoiniformans TaxID=2775080 RepID=UPI00223C1AE2|nr:colicin immunity domain-containing protein [Aestuariispira ectoiniformans]